MKGTKEQFNGLVMRRGSRVKFHRANTTIPCPCRTPEGNRDPIWHLQNPDAVVCNEAGFLPDATIDMEVKAFVQPIQSTRATRLTGEYLLQMFGEIQADDHLGIFPMEWEGISLTFDDWSPSGDDYIEYLGHRFTVVNNNTIPAPDNGLPHHHEVGLRVITNTPL